ncbi:MAG: hypothetical protein ACOVLG_05485 [Flavobacterium sp.]
MQIRAIGLDDLANEFCKDPINTSFDTLQMGDTWLKEYEERGEKLIEYGKKLRAYNKKYKKK